MECLDDALLARLVRGDLDAATRLEVLAHADACRPCRELLAGVIAPLSDAGPTLPMRGPAAADTSIEPGARIDHYEVVGVLGHGAMGVVLHARDTVLGRDVALKLLRGGVGWGDDRRLRREAQAMARLSHPNVVAVHGVGTTERGVYVAMDRVDGTTLTRWASDPSRSWRDCVRAWIDAGEGLAAAHDAGLVHRDFKPDNVLVRSDDTVLVTDFGLAAAPADSDGGAAAISADLLESLTQTGVVVGTPRFMSPEQLAGSRVDGRSDQFAFGVSLYRAVYGQYPFEGKTPSELFVAAQTGAPKPAPRDSKPPSSLWSVLARCMRSEPDQRHADMHAVNAALRGVLDARARRGRTVVFVAIATAGIAAGIGAAQRWGHRPCKDVGSELGDAWSAAQRAAVIDTLAAAAAEHAARTAERTANALQDYADGWVGARRDACEAWASAGNEPDPLALARVHCLEVRRQALGAASRLLSGSEVDAHTLTGAVDVARRLPSIQACASPQYLAAEVAPPDDANVVAMVAELEAALADVDALLGAGKPVPALARTAELVRRAKATRYAPIIVKALNASGRAAGATGDYVRGLSTLKEAYVLSDSASSIDVATNHESMAAILNAQGRWDEAFEEYEKAAAVHARVGHTPALLEGRLGSVRRNQGRFPEALERLNTARNRLLAEEGADHADNPELLIMIADVHADTGDFGAARAALEKAIGRLRVDHGDGHPALARVEGMLGSIALEQGDTDQAAQWLDAAYAVMSDAYGSEHPIVARIAANRGNVDLAQGDLPRALSRYRQSAAAFRAALGDEHVDVANAENSVGRVLLMMGEFDDALRSLQLAERTFAAAGEPDHPDRWMVQANIGAAMLVRGRYSEALLQTREAIERATAAMGEEFAGSAQLCAQLGSLLLLDGHCTQGLEQWERARASLAALRGAEHPSVATMHEGAGVALHVLGRLAEAETEYRSALALSAVADPFDAMTVLGTRALLAVVLADRAEHEAARTELARIEVDARGAADVEFAAALVQAAAAMVAARGQPRSTRAISAIEAAQTTFRALGAVEWIVLCSAKLDDAHCGPH